MTDYTNNNNNNNNFKDLTLYFNQYTCNFNILLYEIIVLALFAHAEIINDLFIYVYHRFASI